MAFSSNTYKGITIKFSGDTTQLGNALKDIDRDAKTVNSELSEINKGLKLDSKNVDLMNQKFNKVSEAIDATKKKLEILKEAKKQADEQLKNGEIGETQFKQLEAEISKAENALKRYKNEAKATADKIKSELSSAVDKLASDVKKTSVAVAGIITALGGITYSAANTADELNTLSKVTGLSTEELQRFNYASELVDVSTETLQTSLKRLVRSMQSAQGGSGDAFDAFKELGVNITDAAGQLRSNEDVFYDVIDALGNIENVTQRDAYAMNIFGKSAQDLNPLILAGSGDQADRMGLVFDQKTLDNLNAAKDKIDIAKQQLEGMKMIVGSELVSSFDSLFGGVDKLLKAVQQAKEDGTLAEIADTVAKSLKFLIDLLISAAKFVYKFKEAIAVAAVAMLNLKIAIDIAKLIKSVTDAYSVFSSVAKKAASSQALLNTAMNVAPYAAAAAGIGLVVEALISLAELSIDNWYEEEIDSVQRAADANNEAVKSYKELSDSIAASSETRKKSIKDIDDQHKGLKNQVERLYELDSQTKLTTESQEQMKNIINELKSEVPGLNVEIDNQTGHLKSSKDELIEWVNASENYKKAQAAMQAQTEAYSELFSLESSQKKLQDQHDEIKSQIVDLTNEKKQLDEFLNIDAEAKLSLSDAEKLEREKAASRYEEIERELDILYLQAAETTGALEDVETRISDTNEELDYLGEAASELTDEQKDLIESTEEEAEATSDLTEKIEENSRAYENAKSRLSTYKSELSGLLSLIKEVNSGTAYSTSQILDLIEKYPQLSSAIRLTSDGYTIEAESIESLVKQKAELMLMEAREAQELAAKAVMNAAYSGDFELIPELDQEFRRAKEYAKNIEAIVNDIQKGIFKEGTSGSTSSGSTSSSSSVASDTTDYWKQAAEQEVAEAEHLYKMGEISAEEYYRRLDEINKRYYENRAEYLDEYNKLAETVYSGLKKLEDDQISNTQNLIDRINEVKRAREALENAENQKVRVYSSAAGFHAELNRSAIDSAAQTLQSAQFNLAKLLQSKFDMKIELPDISGVDLKSILPDLSGIKIPSASSSGSKQTTVNYQAGNIYITGSVDSETVDKLRKLMESETKEFFDKYLDEYIAQADRDRQTEGD